MINCGNTLLFHTVLLGPALSQRYVCFLRTYSMSSTYHTYTVVFTGSVFMRRFWLFLGQCGIPLFLPPHSQGNITICPRVLLEVLVNIHQHKEQNRVIILYIKQQLTPGISDYYFCWQSQIVSNDKKRNVWAFWHF